MKEAPASDSDSGIPVPLSRLLTHLHLHVLFKKTLGFGITPQDSELQAEQSFRLMFSTAP
ncbi:hypothetical protein BaRGS_00025130, partial [Batillaria attramentaria]